VLNVENCIFSVQADEAAWTEATFCRLDEELEKYENRNHLIRTAWTPFIVQTLGVIFGFILSLWAAFKISP